MRATKPCRKCGLELTDENWSPSRQRKSDHICRACLAAARRQPNPSCPRVAPYVPAPALKSADDLLAIPLEALETLEEIAEFVRIKQARRPEYVPLVDYAPEVGRPDALLLHALKLAGPDGLTTRRLHQAVPVSYTRFSDALNRLAYDRVIGRSGMYEGFLIERFVDWRPDAKGVLRLLVVWHLSETCGPVDPWSAAAWTELAVPALQ